MNRNPWGIGPRIRLDRAESFRDGQIEAALMRVDALRERADELLADGGDALAIVKLIDELNARTHELQKLHLRATWERFERHRRHRAPRRTARPRRPTLTRPESAGARRPSHGPSLVAT